MTKLILVFAAIAAAGSGQSVPAPALPQDWVGAGGGYSSTASPKTTAWASIAILANKANQVFSYSTYDIIPQRNLVPVVSVRTGAATVLRTFGIHYYVLGFATAGVSVTAVPTTAPATPTGTAAAVSGSFSGGGMLLWKSENGWTAEIALRLVTGSTNKVAEFGFGRTF